MLSTYCKESKDNYTCAHHIGVSILEGKIRWSLLVHVQNYSNDPLALQLSDQ